MLRNADRIAFATEISIFGGLPGCTSCPPSCPLYEEHLPRRLRRAEAACDRKRRISVGLR